MYLSKFFGIGFEAYLLSQAKNFWRFFVRMSKEIRKMPEKRNLPSPIRNSIFNPPPTTQSDLKKKKKKKMRQDADWVKLACWSLSKLDYTCFDGIRCTVATFSLFILRVIGSNTSMDFFSQFTSWDNEMMKLRKKLVISQMKINKWCYLIVRWKKFSIAIAPTVTLFKRISQGNSSSSIVWWETIRMFSVYFRNISPNTCKK